MPKTCTLILSLIALRFLSLGHISYVFQLHALINGHAIRVTVTTLTSAAVNMVLRISTAQMDACSVSCVAYYGWGHIAFSADPVGVGVGVGVASCLHSIF